eukprot:3118708-Pyramimonas_sp.AAC.1
MSSTSSTTSYCELCYRSRVALNLRTPAIMETQGQNNERNAPSIWLLRETQRITQRASVETSSFGQRVLGQIARELASGLCAHLS